MPCHAMRGTARRQPARGGELTIVMHHVTKVALEGFWDTHDFELKLFPEVTFLIGPNGTGKTTLINLIAAALTADFRTLDRIPFKKITVSLNAEENNEEPRITVTKSRKKERPFESIEYRVKTGAKGMAETRFSLADIEEQAMMRRHLTDARSFRDYARFMPSELTKTIQDLVTVNWLSVHRTPSLDRTREERSYESAVDQRLEAISNELVRFFSTLSRKKDDEIRIFQESLFISLIEEQSGANLFNYKQLESLPNFVNALQSIFSELHVSQPDAIDRLNIFEVTGKRLKEKIDRGSNKSDGLALDDAVFLLGLKRVSAVVDRWNDLQDRQANIFAPRDRWLKITNDLLLRKQMELTASNELQFVSRTGKILKAQMLSSGEKQLLILLSETLLQRERPAIFIADEPELSLHVLWQEKLVESLRALNPSAQIIAATHSPDIVGVLSDRAIDMENIIP